MLVGFELTLEAIGNNKLNQNSPVAQPQLNSASFNQAQYTAGYFSQHSQYWIWQENLD